MNKQELIKRIEDLPYKEGPIVDKIDISRKGLLELVKQLDEPQKVTIPQCVAEYIERTKNEDYHLLGAMTEIRSHKNKEIDDWFYTDDNMELFARAWLDGYTNEEEKRYFVKMKGIAKYKNYLVFGEISRTWFFASVGSNNVTFTHTRKELEDAGFSEVFNSPLFEVEEVE